MNVRVPVFDYGVTFNELPTELALYFEIGGCCGGCKGCHSPELWGLDGCTYLDKNDILDIIEEYKKKGITAVVFMGGLHNKTCDPYDMLLMYEDIATSIDVGVYTDVLPMGVMLSDIETIKWFKIGEYDAKLGGLESPLTNQRFYENTPSGWVNKTNEYFWERNQS